MSAKTAVERQNDYMQSVKEKGGEKVQVVFMSEDIDNLNLVLAATKRTKTSILRGAIERWANDIREASK